MTLIVSTASRDLVTLSVDSTITEKSDGETDYIEGGTNSNRAKYRLVEGIGVIAMWGDLTGPCVLARINSLIRHGDWTPNQRNAEDLLSEVKQFFENKIAFEGSPRGPIGCHIAGFDSKKCPVLYHVSYNYPESNPKMGRIQMWFSDHSVGQDCKAEIVYNGRNDIVNRTIELLLEEGQRSENRYNPLDPIDRVLFAGHLLKHASVITREVGPPYITFFISSRNEKIKHLDFSDEKPLDIERVRLTLEALHLPMTPSIGNQALLQFIEPISLQANKTKAVTATRIFPFY